MLMPAVVLLTASLIGALALSAQKVQASFAAATLARAEARGEDSKSLAKTLGVGLRLEHLEDFVCAHALVDATLMQLDEVSCARKLGL